MLSDAYKARMSRLRRYGSLGNKLVHDSNLIEDKFFHTSQGFKNGMLYDWDMNPLEMVDFRLEKGSRYYAEGTEQEYRIRFRPDYNPEYKYKNNYYKQDGRERLGFYIDIYDESKQKYEKWLIVGKDDRIAFDRYNVMKCNWMFEWITNGKYYRCEGVLRIAANSRQKDTVKTTDLGGSSVNGQLAFFLPSNEKTSLITYGTKFILSDNIVKPQAYEVIQYNDAAPLGTIKYYVRRTLFNKHTDFYGIVNECKDLDFIFELPLEDLPQNYGASYHAICDCIKRQHAIEPTEEDEWTLKCNRSYLFINGDDVIITAENTLDKIAEFHIFIDDEEYTPDEISDYFNITINENVMTIKCINEDMIGYDIKVYIYDDNRTYEKFVQLEVRL